MRSYDKYIAALFAFLMIGFLILAAISEPFFNWAYERHQNQLSWYIRPLFLIPFCYFAYKHSLAGISITVFCLFTSMFWFSAPATVSEDVKMFLQFEKDWLMKDWDISKVLLVLTIPLSFILLSTAFWKRSLWLGLAVIILMATGKVLWSISNAGEAGMSIIVPAVTGLLICLVFIYCGHMRLHRRKNETSSPE